MGAEPTVFGRELNGRSGACEVGNLTFVRPTVIDRFRPEAKAPVSAKKSRISHQPLIGGSSAL